MAEVFVHREPQPPVLGVTLKLSAEEAVGLRKIVGNSPVSELRANHLFETYAALAELVDRDGTWR